MADEQSTSTDEVIDTSVDANVGDSDVEDFELDLEGMESESDDDLTEEESSDEDSEAADEPSEDESESEDEDVEPELSDADKQKQANHEMAQRRIQEKEARAQQIKQQQQAYIAEAAENRDPLELAVRELQVREYNNNLERVTNTVTNQYERAINDFPVLSTKDPAIQAEIDNAIDAFQAQHVTIDPYGNPADVSADLYAFLQAKAGSLERLTGIRAKNQEKSKAKEKSKAVPTPGRAPQKPKGDPMIDAFDEAVKELY